MQFYSFIGYSYNTFRGDMAASTRTTKLLLLVRNPAFSRVMCLNSHSGLTAVYVQSSKTHEGLL